jgi:hypothetical protein
MCKTWGPTYLSGDVGEMNRCGSWLMWDGWLKRQRCICTILSCVHDFNAYGRPASIMPPTCIIKAWIYLLDRSARRLLKRIRVSTRTIRLFFSSMPSFVFYRLLSRAFTLLILYPPYSLLHSLALCSLSYPTHLPFVVLCYRILIVLHLSCIHDLPSSAISRHV